MKKTTASSNIKKETEETKKSVKDTTKPLTKPVEKKEVKAKDTKDTKDVVSSKTKVQTRETPATISKNLNSTAKKTEDEETPKKSQRIGVKHQKMPSQVVDKKDFSTISSNKGEDDSLHNLTHDKEIPNMKGSDSMSNLNSVGMNSSKDLDFSVKLEKKENNTTNTISYDTSNTEILQQKEKEISQIKQSILEKKQLQEEINRLNNENTKNLKIIKTLTEEKANAIKNMDLYSDELTVSLDEKEKLVKENLDLTSNIKELESKLAQNANLEQDLENARLDLEIRNEEYEALKLDLENVKFNSIAHLDPESAQVRIVQLEKQLKDTEEALFKLETMKSIEIKNLNKQLNELTDKAKVSDLLPKKEEEIKILANRVEELENINNDLNEQLNVFTGASMMMDDLINQKMKLETDLEAMIAEKDNLKLEIETSEELILEYENAAKISQDVIRDKENQIIDLNNTIAILRNNYDEYAKKEEAILKSYTEIKNENKLLREEIVKSKGVNVDQIINKNSNINSQLKTYQRRSILEEIFESDHTLVKNKSLFVNEMIPKQIFEKCGYDSFDKYILLISIRKKILSLTLSLIENDFVKNDKSESTHLALEEENNKYFNFIKNLTIVFSELNGLCLHLEIAFSQYSKEQFKDLSKQTFWSNFYAANQMIDTLIKMIKEDNFSIKFQFDPLKTLMKVIQDEAKNNLNINFEERSPICIYNSEILSLLIHILYFYNSDKRMGESTEKLVNTLFFQVKKILKRIDDSYIFEFSGLNQVFDIDITYFKNLVESKTEIINWSSKSDPQTFEKYFDSLSKICIIVTNSLEKRDKENAYKETENKLPIQSCIDLCLEVKSELEESAKTRLLLDETYQKLEEMKIEKLKLESKIDDLNRNKNLNDKKLGEALLISGKVPQLEDQLNEYKKKIEKYNSTIDNLREQLDIEASKVAQLEAQVPKVDIKKGANRKLRSEAPMINAQGSGLSGDAMIPLLSTICSLQKERKYLKSKLMKEKLENLFGEESYVNKYIEKVQNSSNPDEKENILKIEPELENLSRNYRYIRNKLCTPKILDLSEKANNDFIKIKTKQENKISQMRADYLTNIDNILFGIFGSETNDKNFKEIVDLDISKNLKYFKEKKMMVGKISFENKEKGIKVSEDQMNSIPIYVGESSIKLLNKTFMH